MTCDLVLLTHHFPALTERFLQSLRRHDGAAPVRIVWVDNASAPEEQVAVRAALQASGFPFVEVLRAENGGFPRGMNDGIDAGDSEFVILANNDVELANAAVTEMLRVAQCSQAAILNPMSTNESRPDWRTAFHGRRPQQFIDALAAFEDDHKARGAWLLEQQRGQWWPEYSLSYFFTLLRRADTIGRIGYLDESYDLGWGEDDQYGWRAEAARLRSVVAPGAFVVHEHRGTWRRAFGRRELLQRWEHAQARHEHWRTSGRPMYIPRHPTS